jgi:hypothetical protein
MLAIDSLAKPVRRRSQWAAQYISSSEALQLLSLDSYCLTSFQTSIGGHLPHFHWV